MENQMRNGSHISESGIFKKILAQAEEYIKKPLRVKELLNSAYKKASDKKDLGTIAHDVWESLQTLSRLIKAAVTGEYTGMPTSTLVGGVAVLLYFLTPIDFVPDFIPVIGLLDDVALLAWFMTSIKSEMDKFEAWEKGNQAKGAAANFSTAGTETGNIVQKPVPTVANQNIVNDPQDQVLVKDFTAHDLNGSNMSPNDSSIRANSSGSGEPNVRAATTDSTRIPNSNNDDSRAGGNVR